MKSNEPGPNDEALRKLLKAWRIGAALPPGFQEHVWRRIEQAERSSSSPASSAWPVLAHWIAGMLTRPAVAAAYVAVLLTIGVGAGWTQARQETARVKTELGERYVRLLDPSQVPRQ